MREEEWSLRKDCKGGRQDEVEGGEGGRVRRPGEGGKGGGTGRDASREQNIQTHRHIHVHAGTYKDIRMRAHTHTFTAVTALSGCLRTMSTWAATIMSSTASEDPTSLHCTHVAKRAHYQLSSNHFHALLDMDVQ